MYLACCMHGKITKTLICCGSFCNACIKKICNLDYRVAIVKHVCVRHACCTFHKLLKKTHFFKFREKFREIEI